MAKNKTEITLLDFERSGGARIAFSEDSLLQENLSAPFSAGSATSAAQLEADKKKEARALMEVLGYTDFDGYVDLQRKEERKNKVSKYKTYYYSGGQAQVYMQDILLDEISNLQFSTVTNKSPIYGYASERFDTVAKGNMIVQGSFTINFVNANYLQILAEAIAQDLFAKKRENLNGVSLLEDLAGGKLVSEFRLQQALNQIRGLGNKQFRVFAEQVQRQKSVEGELLPKFYEIPPFDIFAIFGDTSDPNSNTTARRMSEVHLTGQSQVLYSNGDPIQEQYSFIARDIE